MPITKQKVEMYEMDYICDVCGTGKMRIDSVTYIAPNYPHKCDNRICGHKQIFVNVKYPITGYCKVGEPTTHIGDIINHG